MDTTVAGGSNAKVRILRLAARQLGIAEETLVYSGHRRAIFVAPLASNWREFLLGKTKSASYLNYSLSLITDHWKEKWLSRRLENPSVQQKVKIFRPEEFRVADPLQV